MPWAEIITGLVTIAVCAIQEALRRRRRYRRLGIRKPPAGQVLKG